MTARSPDSRRDLYNAKRTKLTAKRQQVIDALQHDWLTITALAKRLDWDRMATEAFVRRMEDAGLLNRRLAPLGYEYGVAGQDSHPEAVAARLAPYRGLIVPSRTPPEWKPLRRDPFSHQKLALLTR